MWIVTTSLYYYCLSLNTFLATSNLAHSEYSAATQYTESCLLKLKHRAKNGMAKIVQGGFVFYIILLLSYF